MAAIDIGPRQPTWRVELHDILWNSRIRRYPPLSIRTQELLMIDDPEKTDRLLVELKASLPVRTRLSQNLIRMFARKSPDLSIPSICSIVSVFYAGDEGGIVCGLDVGGSETKALHFVSITHLSFDRRMPLFRRIATYQHHRIKKLKKQPGRSG